MADTGKHWLGHRQRATVQGGQQWVTGFLDKQWLLTAEVCFLVLLLLCDRGQIP